MKRLLRWLWKQLRGEPVLLWKVDGQWIEQDKKQ